MSFAPSLNPGFGSQSACSLTAFIFVSAISLGPPSWVLIRVQTFAMLVRDVIVNVFWELSNGRGGWSIHLPLHASRTAAPHKSLYLGNRNERQVARYRMLEAGGRYGKL